MRDERAFRGLTAHRAPGVRRGRSAGVLQDPWLARDTRSRGSCSTHPIRARWWTKWEEDDWVQLRSPDGGAGLSFQLEMASASTTTPSATRPACSCLTARREGWCYGNELLPDGAGSRRCPCRGVRRSGRPAAGAPREVRAEQREEPATNNARS